MARKPAFISHSREREAQIQSRMLDVLERRFRRQIAKAIEQESDEILSGYRDLGYVPTASDDAARRFRDVYQDLALASARTFGARIVTKGKAAGYHIETKQEEGGFAEFFRALAASWINLEPIRRRITSVTETTREQIVRQVARGQADGLGVAEIAKNITNKLPEISRQRGALISRTESHGAANYAMHETAKSTDLETTKEWVSVEDGRTRAISRDDKFDHLAMDGQIRDMDDPFDMPWIGGGGQPLKIMFPGEAGKPAGAVINCLPPWALVRLAGIKRVMRCEYIGDLLEFSFAGPVNFTVTANHPVLTLSGWKAARNVVKGDKLIHGGIGHSVPIRPNLNVENGHARVDQLYDALKALSSAVRTHGGAVNFHGDVPNGDVDIVSADGLLRDAFKSEGCRSFGEIGLADTGISKGLLLAKRMIGLSDAASANFSDGGVSRFGAGHASLGAGHGSLSPVPLANIGALDAEVAQACVNHGARNIHLLGNAVGAVTVAEHAQNVRFNASANDAPTFSWGSFEPVEVVSVKSRHYFGPVYNCETDSGLIISDGIVNHNCRCAVIHGVKGLD